MDTNSVLIIGSGCTGLALAQGLKMAGVPCIVFEKNAALQVPNQRDWNMGLHWAAPILQQLIKPAQWAKIQSVSVDPHTPLQDVGILNFLNGVTGEKLGHGITVQKWHRLRRSKLRSLLAEGIDIRYGKTLTNISNFSMIESSNGVIATFDDGGRVMGRILVGADGAKSKVRQLIAGPDIAEVKRLPYVATFIQAKYTREQALFLRSFHPLYLASPHPTGRFAFFGAQDILDPEDPETWTFFSYISWPSSFEQQAKEKRNHTNKERLQQVKALASEYCEPWKSAFAWLPEDNPCWHMNLSVWDPSANWWWNHKGSVTLAGDAAHPMTYQRGQGLNHSLTDAGRLTTAISSFMLSPKALTKTDSKPASQKAAIDAYEVEMKARGGEEVRMSETNTTMLHDWAKVLESPVLRNGLAANKKNACVQVE